MDKGCCTFYELGHPGSPRAPHNATQSFWAFHNFGYHLLRTLKTAERVQNATPSFGAFDRISVIIGIRTAGGTFKTGRYAFGHVFWLGAFFGDEEKRESRQSVCALLFVRIFWVFFFLWFRYLWRLHAINCL